MKPTHKRAVARILTLLSLAVLAGCGGDEAKPSTWYPTNSIYTYMQAVQDQSGDITTTVQLRDGATDTASFLYMSEGDALYSTLDVPPEQYTNFNGDLFSNSVELSQKLKAMSSRDLFVDHGLFTTTVYGSPEYFVLNTPGTTSPPTRAYVGFERGGQMITGSSVDLPTAFQIIAPASEASISRSAPVTLSWTDVDPATTMELDVAGVCLDDSRFTKHLLLGTDTGAATLNYTDYLPATGISPTINCRLAFLLQRVHLGGVSQDFAFGAFKGVQQRTVQFTSVP